MSRELRENRVVCGKLLGFKGQGGDRQEGRRWGVWDRLSLEGNQSSRGYGQAPEVGGRDARVWTHPCKHSLRGILLTPVECPVSVFRILHLHQTYSSCLKVQLQMSLGSLGAPPPHPPIPLSSAPPRPCGSNFSGVKNKDGQKKRE